jgi:hypothetical protein
MNWIDQDVPIKNADKLAARREDPLVTAIQAGVPEAFAQLYILVVFTERSLELPRTQKAPRTLYRRHFCEHICGAMPSRADLASILG